MTSLLLLLLQKEREAARELAQVGYRDKVRPMPGTSTALDAARGHHRDAQVAPGSSDWCLYYNVSVQLAGADPQETGLRRGGTSSSH